ncbi:hypothetical protein, partial [Thiorhodococcus minor]
MPSEARLTMSRLCKRFFIPFVIALVAVSTTSAEEIRDFYAEPGLHPFKEKVHHLNETIDPFSGTLQLAHTDITIPGNGGLDINISRFYTNPQTALEWTEGIVGIGWTMHFGRIVAPSAHWDKACSQQSHAGSTADNPSLEHPDGARELLVLATDNSGDLVTKSNWRVHCTGAFAFEVHSPDGLTYLMDRLAASEDGQNRSWYTSRITDLRGNSIEIVYIGLYQVYVSEVRASDGREVTFEYDSEGPCRKLESITANGETWTYQFEPVTDPGCMMFLTEVNLPSGERWQYDYYRDPFSSTPGRLSLSKVVYPRGGEVTYTYQQVYFNQKIVPPWTPTTSVQAKSTFTSLPDGGVEQHHWTYSFSPGGREAQCSANAMDLSRPAVRRVESGLELAGIEAW